MHNKALFILHIFIIAGFGTSVLYFLLASIDKYSPAHYCTL